LSRGFFRRRPYTALHLVELLRIGVTAGGVHATAHVRINGKVGNAHEELALSGPRDGSLRQAEVGGVGKAREPGSEEDLLVCGGHNLSVAESLGAQ
jgi:hypothetical protein